MNTTRYSMTFMRLTEIPKPFRTSSQCSTVSTTPVRISSSRRLAKVSDELFAASHQPAADASRHGEVLSHFAVQRRWCWRFQVLWLSACNRSHIDDTEVQHAFSIPPVP